MRKLDVRVGLDALTDKLEDLLDLNPGNGALRSQDMEARFYRKLQQSLAKGGVPNLWNVYVSQRDADQQGIDNLTRVCGEALQTLVDREMCEVNDGLLLITMVDRRLAPGKMAVETQQLSQLELRSRYATAKIANLAFFYLQPDGSVASQATAGARGCGDAGGAGGGCSGDVLHLSSSWGAEYQVGDHGIVGSATRCDVVCRNPFVSRIHGEFIKDDRGCWRYLDRGSKNGSSINGEPVTSLSDPLRQGDRILLAEEALLVVGDC